jgi:hypothetical protein
MAEPRVSSMTVEDALRRALADAARGRVTFPRDFQGFPETVHGGAVAGLFYRVTTPQPPVHLRMELSRSVPTETPLALTTGSQGTLARLALAQADRRLAEATLSRDDVPPPDARAALAAWREGTPARGEVPGTATCVACGSASPLALGLRFRFNDRLLWREHTPRDGYRAADGSLHPVAVTIALDELGWWLGALAQGECGVTTEVELTVYRPIPFGPVVVLGDRAAVTFDDDPRGRYCRASGVVVSADGDVVAAGRVRFAGSRAYTKRLLQPFLETTDAEVFCRFFPGARELLSRT